jgi:hypothetical protein
MHNEGAGTEQINLVNGRRNVGSGNPPVWTPSPFGPALQFNGTDQYLNYAHTPSYNITGDITILARVKRSSLVDQAVILAKTNGTLWDFDFYFDSSTNRLGFYSDGATPTGLGSDGDAVSDTDRWHQVGYTRIGSTCQFYVDGRALGSSGSQPGAFPANSYSIYIGYDVFAGTFFNGAMDHVLLYNRGLLPAEFSQDFREPYHFLESTVNRAWFLPIGPPPVLHSIPSPPFLGV